MKILVLGGHGFIGHHLCRQLLDSGHEVSVVDIHHRYGEFPDWEYLPVLEQRLAHIGPHESFVVSTTDPIAMQDVFAQVRPDIVVDLATYPNAKMVKKNVTDATENMITATAIALNLCVEFNVKRFVFASSSMVYGDFDAIGEAPNETSKCNPLTLYGSYKLQGEQMCKIWNKEHGLEYAILRPSALYGTRDMVVRAISKMTVSAITSNEIQVNGPTNKLDFSWVDDVAAAFATAATHPACVNEIFNCTRGDGRTILEAAELIKVYFPDAVIRQLAHDEFYPSRDTLNSSKLQQLTNWSPKVSLPAGIEQYLDWFLTQNYIEHY